MTDVILTDPALTTLCPFHFRLGPDLAFRTISPALMRLIPDAKLGDDFVHLFFVERPVIKVDFTVMTDCHRVMFLLRSRQKLNGEEVILRGQMMHLTTENELLFVGNPRVRDLGDLKRLGLTMRDFGVDSMLTDYLLVIQAQQLALGEAQRLANDLARARDAALHASNQKSEFLANMSHELRTPLNAILGFSDIIATEMIGPAPENYRRYAADIHGSGQLLLAIINDVLDMARIEAGYYNLEDDDLDLDAIMQDCIKLLAARASERQIAVNFSNHLPGRRLRADGRAIKQISLNLLSNAVKFNKPGGVVEVSFTQDDAGDLAWRFADNGIGIPDDVQARLFRPFQQAGAKTTRKFGGTGLGLSITRNLVELHGGQIDLTSQFGAGSTFTITLPADRLV